jgi:Probable Zinc-ribbon domain
MMLKPMRAKDGQKTIADDPDLLAAFSPKNGDLAPQEVGYRARRLVWWRCTATPVHEWQAAPAAMKGCPVCAEARQDGHLPESAAMPKAARPSGAPTEPPGPVQSTLPPPASTRPSVAPAPTRPSAAPPGLRALPIDLDLLEEAFCDGALCFLSPLTGEVFLPRKWRDDCPGYVRVPYADRRKWVPDFIAAYVGDPRRQALLQEANTASEFAQSLDEKEEVQWAAYSAARCGMELRSWLEGLGIRVIPRRSGRAR